MRALVFALAVGAADAARATVNVEQDLGAVFETVDEAAKSNSAAVQYIKVVTLNALAKKKCSASVASFPTVTEETVRVLDIAQAHGVDIVAVQESDKADVSASTYGRTGSCVTWADPPPGTGDPQHLCWNSDTIQLSRNQEWGCKSKTSSQIGGITACTFNLVVDPTKSITVMAAHATPNFAEAVEVYPSILEQLPDLVLMDANQNGSLAKSVLGGDYSIFPEQDSTITTIKSAFKYRKLAQAFEGTCKQSRKCTADEQGFANLPDELRTCKLLLESHKCGDMSSKASEGEWEEAENVCKYASRVCGEYERDYKSEMDKFLATHRSVPSRGDFDLKRIRALLGYDRPTVEDTVTKKAQEDVIIFKNSGLKLVAHSVFPGTDNAAFMAEGEKAGFPNKQWPSDHFLVGVALKI